MDDLLPPGCTAFNGTVRIATGDLTWVAMMAKETVERDPEAAILVFDNHTSRVVEVDLRGTRDDVLRRLAAPPKAKPAPEEEPHRGPGRPRLGVVSREVTLLPRHWEWLSSQPGGASVTLRRLVDEARRTAGQRDRTREAQETAYRFMSAMAGDEAGFEEATRALFASDLRRFGRETENWPVDVRDHAYALAAAAFRSLGPDRAA
ncbi:MAG: DUF2239 family protein [Alphaproteobacteria bacterium]|nr:DUF2239 family protein [Alphaproteobacteria bacterium]